MAGNIEWVLGLVFLCLLVAELVSVRRSIRRAKDSPPAPTSAPPPRDAER